MVARPGDLVDGRADPAVVGSDLHLAEPAAVERFVRAIEGAVGAMVDYNLRIWDVAATAVLIEEVGGRYVRVNAEEPHGSGGERHDVVFGKPAVVEWVLKVIENGKEGERP